MSEKTEQLQGGWLTVGAVVRQLNHTISEDKVRTWCRNKQIEGVINIGDPLDPT